MAQNAVSDFVIDLIASVISTVVCATTGLACFIASIAIGALAGAMKAGINAGESHKSLANIGKEMARGAAEGGVESAFMGIVGKFLRVLKTGELIEKSVTHELKLKSFSTDVLKDIGKGYLTHAIYSQKSNGNHMPELNPGLVY